MSEKANKEKISFPLSLGQTALYFLHINSPESPAYNVVFTTRIISPINVSALKKSFQKLLNRHQSLRTNFKLEKGKPIQEISGYKEIFFKEIDASGHNEEELKKKISNTSKFPFDLEKDDLLKIYLYKIAEGNFVLLVSMHHIIADGWSIGIMIDEFFKLYVSECNGYTSELPVISKKFSEHVQYESSFIESDDAARQLNYWKEELNGLPVLDLPADKQRQPVQNYNGATEYFEINKTTSEGLKKISQAEGTTLFTALLATYQIFLHKYTGQDDIVTGIPTSGREKQGFDNTVGYFINPVSIRSIVSDNPPFKNFLSRVKKKILDARSNQELPFATVVEKLLQKRDPSRSPVFQTFFGLQKFLKVDEMQEMIVPGNEEVKISLANLTLQPFDIPQQEGQFDMTAEFAEGKNIFSGAFKYNTDLFEKETIKQMTEHFINLLDDIVKNPGKKFSELNLLSDEEKNKILIEWNSTDFTFNNFKCVHKIIQEQTSKTPDSTAVIFEDESLTYSELNKRSNQLANYLTKSGVKSETTVGLCVERSFDMIIGILGILKAGGAYIPVDVNYPKSRIEFMLSDSNAKILITQKNLIEGLPDNIDKVILIDDDWNKISKEEDQNPERNIDLKNLAYVIYTSGSTGTPKGVMIDHGSLTNHMLWMIDRFKPDSSDSVFQKTPFSFDASVWEFYLPLMTGGKLVIAKPEGHMNTFYLAETIVKNKITMLQLVPSLLRLLLNEKEFEKCKSLKKIFSGGEQLTIDLKEKLFAKLDVQLYNFYGPTEVTIDSVYYECKRKDKTIPIGKPVYNTQAYIVDKYLNPVPAGVHGELLLGGIGVARGYINNSILTEEKFIDDIFKNDGSKLYKTGDLAKFRRDGNIDYLGRIDRQIKLRGFRIELEEIESRLANIDRIVSCAVIVREDKSGSQRISAYIVKNKSVEIDAEDLKKYLRDHLPEYMIPNSITFLDELPLLPNGKVDKDLLPIPESEHSKEKKYIEPEGHIEKALSEIWKEVMGLEKISSDDNFFLLGGDSIISIQIISKAYQSGMRITPKQIFQFQTIRELAKVVELKTKTEAEQGIVTGEVVLTPVQLWFFEQNLNNPDHYTHSVLLDVPTGLDEKVLEDSFNELIRHHDALRLQFKKTGNGWEEYNNEPYDRKIFSSEDITSFTNEQYEKDIELQKKNTDIAKGYLVNSKLYKRKNTGRNKLLIVIHHLAVDGISWRIILEDLYNIYYQISNGESPKLPSKTTSFKEWSHKLSEYASSEKLYGQINYWLAMSELNSKNARADNFNNTTVNDVETLEFELTVELTHLLLKEVPKSYNTQINDILLSALIISYSEWTDENKIAIDLEGHGREELFDEVNLSRTVGWFTSIFPVTIEISNRDDIGHSIKTVKENLRAIPENGTGFGLLKYICNDENIRKKFQGIENNKIIFNYLGQFNNRLAKDSEWKVGKDGIMLSQDKNNIRQYHIEINSMVVNDKLKMEFKFGKNIYGKEEAYKFVELYEDALKEIIKHCSNPETAGFTPSDFSASGLNQQELDNLLANSN